MSPRAVDDLAEEPIEVTPPPKRAAKPQTNGAEVAEVSLPEETLRSGIPIILARVVYLGPGENHSVAFGGQVHETYVEDPEGTVVKPDRAGVERRYTVIKAASTTGTTQYNFDVRDTAGHLIRDRMMPATASQKLSGRPFTWCEHVGHLRRFFLAKDERGERLYHVMVKPEHVALLQEHIRKTERSKRASDQLFTDVTTR